MAVKGEVRLRGIKVADLLWREDGWAVDAGPGTARLLNDLRLYLSVAPPVKVFTDGDFSDDLGRFEVFSGMVANWAATANQEHGPGAITVHFTDPPKTEVGELDPGALG